MSRKLLDHSPDLIRLRDEGKHLEIQGGYLIVSEVPYFDAQQNVQRGKIIVQLNLSGDVTAAPTNHAVNFSGSQPCNIDGSEIAALAINPNRVEILPGLFSDRTFSNKHPDRNYYDYHELIHRYVEIISNPVKAHDPSITENVFPVIESTDDDDPHVYMDTSSSRAQIGMINERTRGLRIAIIGVGGTGSYLLDFLTKTHVSEIHLYDADLFFQHNAFRAPGAAHIEELRAKYFKVAYHKMKYGNMHKRIYDHPYNITSENVNELSPYDFVFVSADGGEYKKVVIDYLVSNNIRFIDLGMGIEIVNNKLVGQLRVTTGAPGSYEKALEHIPIDKAKPNVYDSNIQIAELNALNACLAIIKWKKMLGCYSDAADEYSSVFVLETNNNICENN